jgi:hypothetical protein
MPTHVFIDIEALGRKPGCAPIELGAVVFDLWTGEITDEFHRIIHPHGALKGERETLDWHAERGSYPFTPARYIAAERLPHVIADFLSWLPKEIDSVWAWGATYDFPVLDAAFAAIGETKEPWHYAKQECARTVWRRAFGDRKHAHRPHHALEDCRAGVRDLCEALGRLNGWADYCHNADARTIRAKRERDEAREELESHSWKISPAMAEAKIDELNARCERLEADRNELTSWLKEAVPVMESACCIVAEISPARLGEIEGCRALLETCPVEWERMPHLIPAGDARRSSND